MVNDYIIYVTKHNIIHILKIKIGLLLLRIRSNKNPKINGFIYWNNNCVLTLT